MPKNYQKLYEKIDQLIEANLEQANLYRKLRI